MLRVNAVDAATGVEVTVMGPAGASRREIEEIALKKLAYVLARAKSGGNREDSC